MLACELELVFVIIWGKFRILMSLDWSSLEVWSGAVLRYLYFQVIFGDFDSCMLVILNAVLSFGNYLCATGTCFFFFP